ncbi:MAG: hypothetical protein OEY77_00190 [Nitrospira sp.]|nr:hypothetical protein [Nitrospira sp.]
MGAQGTTVLDFGAFPGGTHATVVVIGQSGILSGSLAQAEIRPVATGDHSLDEHMAAPIKVWAAEIVPSVGFTIHGLVMWPLADANGKAIRMSGQFNVFWVWN